MEKRKFYVHTDKQEMREAGVAKKQLEKLLSTDKIFSERLCVQLRSIQKLIGTRLKANERMLKAEKREKRRIAEEVRKRKEAEMNRAKKNADLTILLFMIIKNNSK